MINEVKLEGFVGKVMLFNKPGKKPVAVVRVLHKEHEHSEKVLFGQDVKVFGDDAIVTEQNIGVGDYVFVQGQLSCSKRELDGKIRYFQDVIANQITIKRKCKTKANKTFLVEDEEEAQL